MRIIYFILFILIFSLLYFGVHYFVYFIISKKLSLSLKALFYLRVLFIVSGISLFIGNFLGRLINIYFLKYYSFLWLGFISIAFFIFFIAFVLMLFFPLKAKIITYSAIMITISIFVFSFINELRDPVVKEITIHFKKIPPKLSGFTIVQLSDLHMHNYTSKKWIKMIVNKTNSLNPDLIVITGDLIEEKIHHKKNFHEILKELKSNYGVIAITGNHEYYAGIKNFLDFAENSNIKVLRNEKITIAEFIDIVGIDDDTSIRMTGKVPDRDSVLDGTNKQSLTVLLYHHPTGFNTATKKGVDLQLSGHTHSGQIPPYDLIVSLIFKYPYGLYKKNNSYIYVTCGTGVWGPPMRFLSRSEIVKIILKND